MKVRWKVAFLVFPFYGHTTRSLFLLFRKMATLRGDRSHGGHWNSDLTAVRIGFAHSFPMKLESPSHCPVEILSETLSALFARSPSKPSIIRPVHYNRTLHYSSNMYLGRTRPLLYTYFHVFAVISSPSFLSSRDSKVNSGDGLMQYEKVTITMRRLRGTSEFVAFWTVVA